MSHLSPQEAAEAQEDTPQPLLDGQTHTAERFTTKLHNDDLQEERETTSHIFYHFTPWPWPGVIIASPLTGYLYDEGSQDDGAEDDVVEDSLKDVPLAVNLAGIELIEDLHQDKRVEHNGVVLRGRGVEGRVPATVDVK